MNVGEGSVEGTGWTGSIDSWKGWEGDRSEVALRLLCQSLWLNCTSQSLGRYLPQNKYGEENTCLFVLKCMFMHMHTHTHMYTHSYIH